MHQHNMTNIQILNSMMRTNFTFCEINISATLNLSFKTLILK